MKFYLFTENNTDKNSFYGIMQTVADTPCPTKSGLINGNDREAVENLTKLVLEQLDETTLLDFRNSIYFKYEKIDDAKYMEWKFRNDDYYHTYCKRNKVHLFSNPAVFLSDVENSTKAKNALKHQKNLIKCFAPTLLGKDK